MFLCVSVSNIMSGKFWKTPLQACESEKGKRCFSIIMKIISISQTPLKVYLGGPGLYWELLVEKIGYSSHE